MEIRTLCDILTRLDREDRKPDLLRYKAGGSWRDISAGEFVETVRSLSLGLAALGVQKGDRVAILSENRPEWVAFDHAILNLGAVSVPLYPSLLTDQARFILHHSQARVLVASTPAQLEKILPVLPSLPDLARMVLVDPPAEPPSGAVPWTAVLREGEVIYRSDPGRFEAARSSITPEDLASILYTSGTTGEPKGVMLTHGNFASNVSSTLRLIPFSSQDVALSFLPLSHAIERLVEFAYLAAGATIAYAESFDAIPRNLMEIRPTCIATVPRLLEKIHARVWESVRAAPWSRRALFHAALAIGRRRSLALLEGRAVPWPIDRLNPAADRMVFAGLREKTFGGRLRFIISGGAPLAPEISEFFHAAGIPVLEGYGLTETSPVISVNTLERTRIGTVGRVIPGVEVRIAGDGEIQVRGPNVMKGYFRNEEATRAAMEGGWFQTGDVGRLDPDGFLRITDRKKEILKTSGGKMIAPQPVENLLKAESSIAQAVLIGDRRKFVSALLVPDFDWLASYARRTGISFRSAEELVKEPRILDYYRQLVVRKMEGRPSYERVKEVRLLPRELSQQTGELTPTLKVKRRVVEEKFADVIASIYRE